MKSNIEDIELLEKYIKDKLSEEQRLIVLQRLEKEKILAEDFAFLKTIKKDIRLHALKNASEIIKQTELDMQISTPNIPSPKKINWLMLTCIVVVLCILSLFVYHLYQKPAQRYPDQFANIFEEKFEDQLIKHSTFRGTDTAGNYTAEQRRAYELYSIKDFKNAIPLLNTLWKEHRDTLSLFYLGVSQIGIGNVKEGEEILNSNNLKNYPNLFQ